MTLYKHPEDWYVDTEAINLDEAKFESKLPFLRTRLRIYSTEAAAIKGGQEEAKSLGLQFFKPGDKVISVAPREDDTFAILKHKVGTSSIRLEGSMSYLDAFTEAMKIAARKTDRALVTSC